MILARVILVLIVIYLAMVFFLYFFQGKLIFLPSHQVFESCSDAREMGVEIITKQREGETLRFYEKKVSNPAGWMVLFHGNSGSVCDRLYYIEELADQQIHITLAEYPGFSNDETPASQKRILSNALALTTDLLERNNDDLPLILFGESLGTSIATYVASQISETKGLILQAPFTSIGEIGRRQYPFAPVDFLIRHNFPARIWAQSVKSPVFAIHSTNDEKIPFDIGKKQMENFNSLTELVPIENAGHNGFRTLAPGLYWSTIKDFIQRILSR